MPVPANEARLAELLCAVSLATDLGTGQAPGHGLRTAVVAVGVAREMGLAEPDVAVVGQVALLRFLGCTADATDTARMVGGDDLSFLAAMAPVAMGGRAEAGRRLVASVGAGQPRVRRARLIAGALADPGGARRSLSSHCEVAARLAGRLGLDAAVVESLAHGYERWDGAGFPDGLAGEAIPLPVRIAVVARDADLVWHSRPAELDALLRARRGHAYDPTVVDAFARSGRGLLAAAEASDPWPAAVELSGDRVLRGEPLERALSAVGDFADLKSPWLRGHRAGVAELAVAAGTACRLPAPELTLLRWAALVADVGRVGVPNGVWDRPGPLTVADWERVRMHPYLTERAFARCASLAAVGRVAGLHHERIDGSGYHRGAAARQLDAPARVLAVADAVAAMGEPRPYRPALPPAQIAAEVAREVRSGRLDAAAADAVLTAAGHRSAHRPARSRWPFELTDREVEVLGLIARSRTNREVAAALHLSPKTVGRHVENIYAKIGVSSRAAAALVAMEHNLLAP
jgi:HD-GYP domain-containing protein (c-di-GMP phosphodiesterase class II)